MEKLEVETVLSLRMNPRFSLGVEKEEIEISRSVAMLFKLLSFD